jgi:hypothetical protein
MGIASGGFFALKTGTSAHTSRFRLFKEEGNIRKPEPEETACAGVDALVARLLDGV